MNVKIGYTRSLKLDLFLIHQNSVRSSQPNIRKWVRSLNPTRNERASLPYFVTLHPPWCCSRWEKLSCKWKGKCYWIE